MPFDESLAVEAGKLDGHDRFGDHLCNGVWWRSNDGSNIAVFKPIEVSFDGFGWIPWGGKEGIICIVFSGGGCAVDGA